VETVSIGRSPLHPDLDILPHRTISTASAKVSNHVHSVSSSGTHGTSAKIRSKSRVFPPPRLILGSKAIQDQLKSSRADLLLTSVTIRHHQAFAWHSAGLVNQHMCSLVVRVVGDEQS
jgi:hypothetical protein